MMHFTFDKLFPSYTDAVFSLVKCCTKSSNSVFQNGSYCKQRLWFSFFPIFYALVSLQLV